MQEWQMLQDLLLTSPRTQVVNRTEHYLHAVSSTAVMRFKDDIELRYSPQQQKVDIRSSSRIGYYDFGVNRNRLEQLRKQFQNITANK
ncbi:Uncharacterised protein [Zhongshania aliphaticivorans]|uniref:DUF1499 domain-containing protein n=2 Tax=Zhongshania aliphaticivorans TaxID=1470434 RepID=A0A5S9MQ18_9GAMM|nr:Uncharacterised protein [Zhongshania aliphaticivorans]CAA0086433.1 Uncharacterised protein [Zhongshania aliphaticivorans]